jgi:hypothetical protein
MRLQKRRQATIAGNMYYQDALRVQRAFPPGECEVEFMDQAPKIFRRNAAGYEMSYELPRRYLRRCIERGMLVFTDPQDAAELAQRL